jgi:hypothetical protein
VIFADKEATQLSEALWEPAQRLDAQLAPRAKSTDHLADGDPVI